MKNIHLIILTNVNNVEAVLVLGLILHAFHAMEHGRITKFFMKQKWKENRQVKK
jgi:hypothetical protein